MIEWLLEKLVGQSPMVNLEEQEERVDSIVARVDLLEERVERIEHPLPGHDGSHAAHA
jgi:hypothetical protein